MMLHAPFKPRWPRPTLALLLVLATCPPPGAAQIRPAPASAPPTLTQVQQAYAQAHPPRCPNCDPENLFFSLKAPQNVVACRPDESTITFYYRGRITTLRQEQEYGRYSFYRF